MRKHKEGRLLALLLAAALLAAGCSGTAGSSGGGSGAGRSESNELTVMTNVAVISGITSASLQEKSTISSWYAIYHKLWDQQFPGMKVNEVKVTDDAAEVTKTLLGVNAGNPPDLIAVHEQLAALVKRGAVENLDSYYAAAGIKPGYFLKPMEDAVRFDGHWYGMPGASNPTQNTLLVVPKYLKAAGIDPNKLPVTWPELWAATRKVTTFDAAGNLTRIGLPVDQTLGLVNLYCGKQTTYDPSSNTFHANAPCVKDYFKYNKRLLDFYGGMAKYTKFITGDPTVWTCSAKAYIPTGKILFAVDAYWSGAQMDTCYDVQWELGPPPTMNGTDAEWAALGPVAWVLAIPKGAKHPQHAFDFVKFSIWEHGDLLGPTTNGYVRPQQASAWGNGLIKHQAQVRTAKGYPGNPMAAAMTIVTKGAELGGASVEKSQNAQYFHDQFSLAWQQVAFGRSTIDASLDRVQKLMDAKPN